MDNMIEDMDRLSLSKPETQLAKIEPDDLVLNQDKDGSGCSSEIFFGKYKDQPVAVKKFLDSKITPEIEGNIHHRARHDYIVKLYGYVQDPRYNGLVMEQCTEGDLFDFITNRALLATLPERESYTLQIAQALAYLHDVCNIIHCDVKPENILITKVNGKNIAKLTDFGLAMLMKPGENLRALSKGAGTPAYVAPELLNRICGWHFISYATDMFSFGIVLKLLVAHDCNKAFLSTNNIDNTIRFNARGGHEHEIPADSTHTTATMHSIITSLLYTDHEKRMPARKVVSALQSGTFVFKSTVNRLD